MKQRSPLGLILLVAGASILRLAAPVHAGWLLGGLPPPTDGPPPGDCGYGGDPVNLFSGLFVLRETDFFLPDVLPIVLTRTYRQNDDAIHPFGMGTSHTYAIYLKSPGGAYDYADLVLPDGGKVHYLRSGTDPSGRPRFEYHGPDAACPASAGFSTGFDGSTVAWNDSDTGFNLKLRDDTVYVFFEHSANLRAIRDRFGNQITVTHASAQEDSDITRITSPSGRWIEFTYGLDPSLHLITQVTDNIGRVVSYCYDTSNRLINVTNGNVQCAIDGDSSDANQLCMASGTPYPCCSGSGAGTCNQEVYTYEFTTNRMRTLRNRSGYVYLTNEYYDSGRIKKQTHNLDGGTFTFDYGQSVLFEPQTIVTDPGNYKRRVTFTSSQYNGGGGYRTSDTGALSTPLQREVDYYRPNVDNRLYRIYDGLNHQTAFAQNGDGRGNLTGVTRHGEPNEPALDTTIIYTSDFNQPHYLLDPRHSTGAVTPFATFDYDTEGNLKKITNILNESPTVVEPVGTSTGNGRGQIHSITDPVGNKTVFDYDLGDLVKITDPAGGVTTRFIDSAGRLAAVTDPVGRRTQYQYDDFNHVTQIKDPLGGQINLSYDPDGNLIAVSDDRGGVSRVTSYKYDGMDRLVSRTDPLRRPETFKYDTRGNLTRWTDRKGQVKRFKYDALNRLISNDKTRYTYDKGDRVTTIKVPGAKITRTYDGFNRLKSETQGNAGTVSYQYDKNSRRTSMTILTNPVSNQPAITYCYDDADRLTGLVQGCSGSDCCMNAATVSIAYYPDGRRMGLTLPNGVTATYGYINARLNSITFYQGTTLLGVLTYTYDAAGHRTGVGGTLPALPVDLTSATYDAANQIMTWEGTSFTYDNNGNLTRDGTNQFTWNRPNQLSKIYNGSTTFRFQYDGLGRRISKFVNHAKTSYLYDGANPVLEFLPNRTTASLLTGLSIDEYFTRTDLGEKRTFLTDVLGSTVALIDDTGNLATAYAYEPFGRMWSSPIPPGGSNEFQSNEFQFSGRENDGTGLYYYRARYYDPVLQRFISEDPIGFEGGDANLYGYVREDPVNRRDPRGRDIWIEGPSSGENVFHVSIDIGDPTSAYISYSFGTTLYTFPFGATYVDTKTGGPILDYIRTTPSQDLQASRELWNDVGNYHELYGLFSGENCITYSYRNFLKFLLRFGTPTVPAR